MSSRPVRGLSRERRARLVAPRDTAGHEPGPFRQKLRVVAEQLDAERPVGRGAPEEFEGLPAVPDQAVHAHHLGKAEGRPLFPRHEPHRKVGDPGHRGEHQVVGQGQRADCQGFGHLDLCVRHA